jgi:general secretion pathway protein G
MAPNIKIGEAAFHYGEGRDIVQFGAERNPHHRRAQPITTPFAGREPIRNMVRAKRKRGLASGFTLIELMIVIAIIAILMSIAAPRYQQSILRAKEAVLKQNLYNLRSAIDQYTMDKQRAPQSLDDLVAAGYFRQLPVDPMTGEANWQTVMDETLMSIDQQEPGITDVHSASTNVSSDGAQTYDQW